MRATAHLLSLLTLTVLLLASLPAGEAFVSDAPMVSFYLQEAPGGASRLGFTPPENAQIRSIPLLMATGNLASPAPICREGVCTPAPVVPSQCLSGLGQQNGCAAITLGEVELFRGFTTAGNAALSLWMHADNPTIVETLQVQLQRIDHGGRPASTIVSFTLDSGQSAEARSLPLQLDADPTLVTLGARFGSAITVINDEKVRMVVSAVKTLTSASTIGPTQVYVDYAAARPTAATLVVEEPQSTGAFASQRRGEHTMGVYLASGGLNLTRPLSDQTSTRAFTGTVSNAPTEMRWGSTPTDEDSAIVGHALFTVFARVASAKVQDTAAPGALMGLGLKISLYVNSTVFTTDTIASPTLLTSSDAVGAWFIGSIPIQRTDVPAGTPIDVGLAFTGLMPNGVIEVLYGSTSHAAGLLVPVEGGGHYFPPEAPPLNLSLPALPDAPSVPTEAASDLPASNATGAVAAPEASFQAGGGQQAHAAAIKKEVSRPATTPGPSLVLLLAGLGLALAAASMRK